MSVQHTPWSVKALLADFNVSVTLAESKASLVVGIDGKHDTYAETRRKISICLLKAGLPVQRPAGLHSVLVVPIG